MDNQEDYYNGLEPRRAALDILDRILAKKQLIDQAIEQSDFFRDLEPRDRAFAQRIVRITLHRLSQIDEILDDVVDRPLAEINPLALLNVLRLGVAQLFFLEVPVHAAVNTTVELAVAIRLERQKGFVNAIMRGADRQGAKILEAQDERRMNLPDWLWESWVKDYGEEVALKIGGAILTEQPLDITVKSDVDGWATKIGADKMPMGSLRQQISKSLRDTAGFDDGEWWVQGAVAAVPAQLFLQDLKAKTVVDLCAAPGGKAAQLANAGANVLAVDRSAKRLVRLTENMERLGFEGNVESFAADGGVWQPSEKVDAVLLDAPCSATGTLRHHPDVLHLKTAEDIEKLVNTQRRLLKNAVDMLKTGGELIYCVCSLQKSEGEDQIKWLLAEFPNMEMSKIEPKELGDWDVSLDDMGGARFLPFYLQDKGGADGFFVARLIRK